jgi:hypothetical protein
VTNRECRPAGTTTLLLLFAAWQTLVAAASLSARSPRHAHA